MSKQRLLKLADNPVAADDEDTEGLESLLGDEDEEDETSVEEQIVEMRKSQAFQAKIMLSLTRSMSALAKHVMALQSDEDEFEATTSTPDSDKDVMEKQESATESSFSPYGSSDLGSPETMHDEETSEEDALSAASEESAESDPGLVSLQRKGRGQVPSPRSNKSKVSKDDASSNFGQKDSDIPGNPPVTPDTKDWPADQTVIPHSDLGPTLQKELREMREALVSAGIIKKAQPRGVGTRVEEPQPDVSKLEESARGMSFQELNRWRTECGELPAGIV